MDIIIAFSSGIVVATVFWLGLYAKSRKTDQAEIDWESYEKGYTDAIKKTKRVKGS